MKIGEGAMKRYLIVLIVILVLTPVLLVGCTQAAQIELENRIASLETKLITAESTIEVLRGRIEQLEERSLTEMDILSALRGKEFWASVGPLAIGKYYDNYMVQIKVE